MSDNLKSRLQSGQKLVGCILLMPSADVAEVIATSGLQVAMIDHEHGGGGLLDFVQQDRAVRGTDMELVVRVPHGDATYAQRLLDNGARGLVFPGIDTAEQAQAAVTACRYPPRGTRGAGAGLRAGRYGIDTEYYRETRQDETMLIVQIESARAVENIDEICAVSGVDMCLIGPRDLSASIGMLDNFADPEIWELVDRAAERIRASGKFLASTLRPGSTITDMFEQGYDLVLAGKDVDFLLAGAVALVAH